MEVKLFMRSPKSKQWSIERVFKDVLQKLPPNVSAKMCYAPLRSVGLVKRILLVFWARWNKGQVNHISGDIHFLAFGLPKSSTILTIHDTERLRRLNGFKARIYSKLWFEWPIKRVALVTAISQRTKDDLVNTFACNPDNIRVIHNPISASFKKSDRPFNAANPKILHLGTRKNKNLERVIPALKGIECTLVIIGDLTTDQQSLLQEANIKFENRFNLSHDEIVAEYADCDIVMFPSLFEGFGLVAVEGQASGKPVITSIGRPFDEVVGQSACLVDPTSIDEIREAVLRILNDPDYRNALVSDGLANAERFRPELIAKEYAAIYDRIAKEAAG